MKMTEKVVPRCAEPEAAADRLEIVLAYDDLEMGRKGRRFCDVVAGEGFGVSDYTLHVWKFDVLQFDEIRGEAVKDAVAADIVVIATGVQDELPVPAEEWMHEWVPARSRKPGKLVLLTNHGDARVCAPALRDLLSRVATSAGMAFYNPMLSVARPRRAEEMQSSESGPSQGRRNFLEVLHGWGRAVLWSGSDRPAHG